MQKDKPNNETTSAPSAGTDTKPTKKRTRTRVSAGREKQLSLLRATGPRTPGGKARSRYNAVKHGIFASAVLPDESTKEYYQLVNDLTDYHQPVGRTEELLVEKLAMQFWRYRRLLEAECAAIVNAGASIQAREEDIEPRMLLSHLFPSFLGSLLVAMVSKNWKVLSLVRGEIAELRERIQTDGLNWERDRNRLASLFGTKSREANSRLTAEVDEQPEPSTELAKKYQEAAIEPDSAASKKFKSDILAFLDQQIKFLDPIAKRWYWRNEETKDRQLDEALVPQGEIADRLQRYEASLERAIDRTLAQLERLQRMRLGHAVPPPIKVTLSD